MTRIEKIARESERVLGTATLRDDMLLFSAGSGLCYAGLLTLIATADAFSARLAASSQQATELSMLQMRQLALSLSDMQPARRVMSTSNTAVRSVSAQSTEYAPGYPVVT